MHNYKQTSVGSAEGLTADPPAVGVSHLRCAGSQLDCWGWRFRPGGDWGGSWYPMGMKRYLCPDELRVLPLGPAGVEDRRKLYGRQRRELERRAEFARRYQNERGTKGFVRLDPVLESHLGLADPTRNR